MSSFFLSGVGTGFSHFYNFFFLFSSNFQNRVHAKSNMRKKIGVEQL